MPDRIRVLDDALVDQIAAGEVVERPASVVKELLENSIDAGAANVTVEIEEGGLALIRVTDDGSGMSARDARLALQRHATSKIRALDDLRVIRSFGFRGEALPSIASVAKLTVTTRERERNEGVRVSVEGGASPSVTEAGCPPGTVVEVRDLFYNVPARKKFLKSLATEGGHVLDACLRAALAHPSLRLVVVRDGKRVREFLPAKSLLERANLAFEETLTPIEDARDGVVIVAALGAPERARTGAGALHIFVNDRPVRDRALARAVAFAYGSVLPGGRFPVGVVHLQVAPEQVDVNVHPQKSEVRFSRTRELLDLVTRRLAAHLGTAAWSNFHAPRHEAPQGLSAEPGPDGWGLGVREAVAPLLEALLPAHDETGARSTLGSLRALAQVKRMFIVCEGPSGIFVLDQHAADERVRYAALVAAYRSKSIARQQLLFPERVECAPAEVALVDDAREALDALGIECAPMGETTVAVRAIPSLLTRAAPARLLRDALDELALSAARGLSAAADKVLATMACHAAIRAGDALGLAECDALLQATDRVRDFQGHCPHGRPILFEIGFPELERKLGR